MGAEAYFSKAYGYRACNKFKDKNLGNVQMVELKTLDLHRQVCYTKYNQ